MGASLCEQRLGPTDPGSQITWKIRDVDPQKNVEASLDPVYDEIRDTNGKE